MLKNCLALFIILQFVSCVSVQNYNKRLETDIAPEKLQADVDEVYTLLQELHPELYWYIPKNELDRKFDSVKNSISEPENPKAFFRKLAPTIASVRQAHLRLLAPEKRLTRKQIRDLKKQKGLLSRYNFITDNNRIFVKDNSDKMPNMDVGTEILEIKGEKVSEMLQRYQPFINSDGYNATFQRYSLSRRWPSFFTLENGILDSVLIKAKVKNEIKEFYISREKQTKEEKKKEELATKKITKSEKGKTQDYNILTKSFNRDLQFPKKDSSVAYMKIKTFSGTFSRKFYKESFAVISKSPAKYLVLDIRDNLGGSLSEITNLYSYLGADQYPFINDIEITSRRSMFKADYWRYYPSVTKPLGLVGYPFYLIGTALSVKKENGKYLLRNNGIFTVKKPKDNAFRGKIYVLMNGSSFSASSIISSKLKGDGRAIIVGEETGGANDGTVAGRYSTERLKNSKLYLPIGLMLIKPNISFTETMKGVTPHVEIIPTVQQILQKKDIELEWVMQDISRTESEAKTQK